MNVLSVQSHVAYGYVGNRAAVFPLQRLGFEVWAVNTVQFSNHTGYGSWTGEVFSAEHVRKVIDGIFQRVEPAACDAVLSGYLGDADLGEGILETVSKVRAARGDAIYACDPVMGDVGRGIFVRPGIPEFMRERALPAADIVIPNQFELELLTGHKVSTLETALSAARAVQARGPKIVVITSLRHERTPDDTIQMLAVSPEGAWLVSTPFLPLEPPPNGAGDAVTALFLAHYLKSNRSVPEALSGMAAAIYEVIATTNAAGTRELQFIAAQEGLVRPRRSFTAEPVT
ncbi:pyridoxal kinase PdxY [Aquibaculum arenosum]|uniref:pyridoxal kinase n=1 Tax=Aquibaculum arenosum TaxID=3032591 RepID=A0ABT5YHW3_9PROT|nr:pyridoxal kinase PdxY [Fodinicurvata sp. CAU 1616]MDF2094413.1 pyridoxal kinase PdxY [Fodinicurvata sp. CAU 1616]